MIPDSTVVLSVSTRHLNVLEVAAAAAAVAVAMEAVTDVEAAVVATMVVAVSL
jgi:hypothetical protein